MQWVLKDYVIGGMDPSFKLKLYRAMVGAGAVGMATGLRPIS